MIEQQTQPYNNPYIGRWVKLKNGFIVVVHPSDSGICYKSIEGEKPLTETQIVSVIGPHTQLCPYVGRISDICPVCGTEDPHLDMSQPFETIWCRLCGSRFQLYAHAEGQPKIYKQVTK